MTKGRLEALSDAVIAIIMTIMVLELRPPDSADVAALIPLGPTVFCYVLSFAFLAIYWNNHHHLIQAAKRVSGGILWANMHLLFWLSLVPFTTAWMGENEFSSGPVGLYGVVMLMSGVAYFILTQAIVKVDGPESRVSQALGRDVKGKASVLAYALAVVVSFAAPLVSCGLYLLVALMWLVPDRRFES